MYPTPVPAMVVPQNPHSAPVGRIRPPAAVAVPNRIEISDVNGLRSELDKFRPYDDSELRGKVEALEAKSEKDPQFGAWKTDVLPGLLAGKTDAALVDARAADTDKRVAVGEGADASGASTVTSPEHPMRAVAVGYDARATGPVATAVGEETRATADSSAAFGSKAESTAKGAVQLGNGVNTTERSLQFRGANLFVVATRDTKVAQLGTGFPYTASVVDSGAVLPTSKAVKDFVEGKGYLTSFKETDPEFAKWRSSTCLSAGFGAKVGTQSNTAVGNAAEATGNSTSAFGTQAKATAIGAVQIGQGTNSTERTLQFRGANLFKVETSTTPVATLGAGFPKASKNVFGAMKVGDNLSVADGVVSAVVPTKTSQLDNDSNFASDVLGRTCVHTYNDPNVPPMAGTRLSADEWMFPYASIGQDPDLRLRFYPDAGEWKIGFVDDKTGHFNQFSYTLHAGSDAAELDFGGVDGVVTFSGADDRVVHESQLPKRTSQLENDSGFVTSVPTKTSQLENDSGFLTSVPTGADIKTSEDDEESLADKIVTLGTVVGEKQDALTDAQKAVLNGGPYVGAIGPQRIDSDGAGASLTIEGDSSNGGAVFIRGGGYNGAFLSVEDGGSTPASIKKGGKEVATEEQVNAVSGKVDEIKSTVSTDNRLLVNGTTASIQTRADETAEWTDEIRMDKGYDAVQGSTMVKLDKSVQTVTVAGGSLTVELPDAVEGTVRDLCLYVNNTSPTATVTMTFPSGVTVYKSKGGDDPKAAAQAGGITAYYFTEIPGGAWRVMRDELEVAA